jgi:hypothetical protein
MPLLRRSASGGVGVGSVQKGAAVPPYVARAFTLTSGLSASLAAASTPHSSTVLRARALLPNTYPALFARKATSAGVPLSTSAVARSLADVRSLRADLPLSMNLHKEDQTGPRLLPCHSLPTVAIAAARPPAHTLRAECRPLGLGVLQQQHNLSPRTAARPSAMCADRALPRLTDGTSRALKVDQDITGEWIKVVKAPSAHATDFAPKPIAIVVCGSARNNSLSCDNP